MKKLQSILAILHEHRHLYLISLISISLATIFAYTGPLIIKTTIDSFLSGLPLDPGNLVDRIFIALGGAEHLRHRLYIPALVLLAVISFQGLFTLISRLLASKAAEGSIEGLRNQLFRHIQKQPFTYFNNVATGDLIQRCTSDIDTIRRFLETQFVEIGNTTIMIFIAVSFMFSIHRPLAWLTVPIIPVTVGFSFFFFRKVQQVFTLSDESEGRLSAMLSEHLRAVRVVKAFGREVHEIARFDDLNMDFRKTIVRLIDLLGVYWGTSSLMSLGQIVLVLGLGTVWAVQGDVTLGTLQVFMAYVWMILWPLRQMGRILVDMGKAFVAIGRITEVLDQAPEDIHAEGLVPRLSGRISFRNVSFAYPARTEEGKDNAPPPSPVLNNINLDIYPGETIGILGPTGSGKTTILHLLAGLYPDYSGEILLDGEELRGLNLWECRKQMGYVLQEPLLFSGSIKKNIRMGWDEADFTGVEQAAMQAEIHQSIKSFDLHYQTIVGERGVTLSGGQKQRMAIARAIIRDMPIYMFDDSLSALDAETDAKIRNNLLERGRAATLLIVSHRLSTIAGADRIIVIEDGRVSQVGSHEELSRQVGLYKRLLDLQEVLTEPADPESSEIKESI